LLKVHTSNYKIVGFTKEVSPAELAVLGKKHKVPVRALTRVDLPWSM